MSNQDQQNDFESQEFDTDLGFDDTAPDENGKKNNPLLKVVLVAGAMIVVLVGIFMLGGGGNKRQPQSEVASAPADENALPAQKEPTPEYKQALQDYNQQMINQAKQSGESVVPIPIDPAQRQLQGQAGDAQEDPAERFRRIQEEYKRQQDAQQAQVQDQQSQAQAEARANAVRDIANAMSGYLSSAVNSRGARHMSAIEVASVTSSDNTGTGGGAGGNNGMIIPPDINTAKIILPATTIEYGQIMIEANTDAPGPVLAMVVTGKLAGSRLLGAFTKTEEYLTMNFTQLVTKDGRTMPITAIAIDPKTTLPGMITEIDRRYLQRYIIPAAADFISGVGQAIAVTKTQTNQTSSSTVTSSDDPDFNEAIAQGISDSFDGISDAIKDANKNVQPMLRVAAGTPIGILFTAPVLDPDSVQQIRDAQNAAAIQAGLNNPYNRYGTPMPGMNGYGGYGYPGIPAGYPGAAPSGIGTTPQVQATQPVQGLGR